MTIPDILVIAISVVAIGGLYVVGRCSRNARRKDSAKKDNQ